MSSEIETWLYSYLDNKSDLFENLNSHEKLEVDIFSAQILDSIEFMDFIFAIEARFKLRFSPENFQDRRLKNLKGICELISEIVRKN